MEFSALLALILTFLITLHLLISWWKQIRQYRTLPPGPTPWPFLGTPKYMDQFTAVENYTMLSKKYGPMFTVWKMSEPVVVLCGYEVVSDALQNHAEEFSSRPIIPTLDFPTKGYDMNGLRWRPLRRFTISTLRNYGMGKKTVEILVQQESTYLNQAMAEMEGKPFNPVHILASAVGNIISTVLFGDHFDYKDPKLHELMDQTTRHIRSILDPSHMICNIFPFLLKVPLVPKLIFKEQTYLQNFVQKYIEEHKRTLNPEAPRDFIDQFLLKIKEVEHEEDPDFCDLSVINVVVGLLGAGSETTASTLKFSLMIMAHYPDVQVKVQQELDAVLQSLQPPGMKDRPQLPYTNAVVHEIQRVLDLAPTALFHSVTKDIKFRGYTLPKGTITTPFLGSVLYDPTQWETPNEFNPGHFLDEEGRFQHRPAFMAFSAGKRICAGENLARMELFIFLSTVLQKFTIKLPPGVERHDCQWLRANKREMIMCAELCAVPREAPTM